MLDFKDRIFIHIPNNDKYSNKKDEKMELTEKWVLTTEIGNLSIREIEIKTLAEKVLSEIMKVPKEIRNNTKESTGVAVFLSPRQCDNYLRFNIGDPSDQDIRYSQRKAEMLDFTGYYTTRKHEDSEKAIYPGGISTDGCIGEQPNETNPKKLWLNIGVSGLKPDEDETIAIIILAAILDVTPKEMVKNIVYGPISENITRKGHYLYEIIQKFS